MVGNERFVMVMKMSWLNMGVQRPKAWFTGMTALLVCWTSGLSGQSEEEELFELSPFTVTAADEAGYAARATTGGVRFRTDLRDIGSQVDVMSLEFLQDVGALSPNEAFLYSLNVENEQENPNYVPDDGNSNNFERRTSGVTARGFGGGLTSGATQSRDFFATQLSLHGYNTGSLAVSSGPNAILFGLGKPGGVIQVGLKPALTNRDSAMVQVRGDNWGSQIGIAEFNKVIIRDKLAVLVAILEEREKHFFRPNFKDQSRIYGTVTYRPWKRLNLRLHFEDIQVEETPSQWLLPNDDVSAYLKRGETTGSFHQMRAVFDFGADLQLRAIWPRYTSQTTGREWVESEIAQPGSPLDPGLDRFKYTLTPETMAAYGFPYDRVNLWGTTQRRTTDANIATAVAEWNPVKDLFFELGLNRERFHGRQVAYGRGARYRLSIDTSPLSPDGSPNPGFESFFVGDTPWGFASFNEEQEWRLTGAYMLDLARTVDGKGLVGALLGRHQIASLVSGRESTDVRQLSWRTWNDAPGQPGVPPPFITAAGAFANAAFSNNYLFNNVRGVSMVQYIDPADRHPYMKEIPGWSPAADVWEFEYEGIVYQATQFDPVIGGFRPAESSRVKIGSKVLAWQGRFWDDRIVLTYGYREDDVRVFRLKTTASPDYLPGERASNSRLQGGNWAWFSEVGFSGAPEIDATYRNESKGIVFHPTGLWGGRLNWLSLFYNESTNNDAGATRLGSTGRPNPTQTGFGRDYGFMINTEGGKFGLRVNWFEAALQNEETGAFGLTGRIYNLEERLAEVNPLGFSPGTDGFDVRVVGRNQISALQDSVANGIEISLVSSPTPRWDLRLTVAKMNKVNSGIARDWMDWLQRRIDYYGEAQWFDMNNPELAVTQWNREQGIILKADEFPGPPLRGWDQIAFRDGQFRADDDSIRSYYEREILGDSIALIRASDGLMDRNVRSLRGNLTATYNFAEGALNGLRLGGSVRYRGKPVVGYPLKAVGTAGTMLPDIENPYYGPSETFLDIHGSYTLRKSWLGATYRFQVNIRNLTDNTGPYVRRTDSQGTGRAYGFFEPRTFIFSLTTRF